MNIVNELQTKRGGKALEDVLANRSSVDEETIKLVAHQATIGMYELRASRCALTGEWLIYAAHGGTNHYLALASHVEGDDVIYSRMMKRCEPKFQEVIRQVTSGGAG